MLDSTDDASPAMGSDTDRTRLLLEFMAAHTSSCPACGYQLHGLTEPRCPECHQTLELTVGITRPRITLLVVALVPSVFSLICGVLLLVLIVVGVARGGPSARIPAGLVVLDAFGLLSGLFGLGLAFRPFVFLTAPREQQRTVAAVTWAIHLAAFIVLVALVSLA